MKTGTIILMAALLIGAAKVQLRAADEVNEALQKGLVEEEANHNLDAAIKAYQSITTQLDEQRKIAATAFFRLGECYRKQGKTNEAAVQYERVIRDFSDDARVVELSRKYLTEMGRVSGAELTARNPLSASQKTLDPAQMALLREEMSLVELQLTVAQKRFENGRADLVEVTRSKRDLLSVKRKLPENSQPAAQKGLIEEEMKLVEQLLSEVKKRIEVGAAAPLDEVPLKRDLIGLRRELAAVAEVSQTANAAAQSTEITDEEAKEIQRIRAMIKNSPDLINAKDKQGDTPLHKAARLGQITVAEFLLASQADVNAIAHYDTPLHLAANSGHKAMTELLLANGADVNAGDNQTALHIAVENGFKAVVEVLLANRADVNAARSNDGWTSLHIAALRGYKAIAELLLTRGADIHARDKNDLTPLHVAAQYGQKASIELLLARKADIDVVSKDGSTPLNLAAGNGRPDAVKALVAGGADVNHQGSARYTPLHSAVWGKSVEMVRSILTKKPNLELRDSDGLTPLQRSVLLNEPRLAELLLSAGANANAAIQMDRQFQISQSAGSQERWLGQPLLHWAIRSNNKRMVEVLLANGADVNARKSDGQTPLHLAVLYQLKDVTELLLKHGANVNFQDNDGKTPLDLAQPQANVGGRSVPNSRLVPPPVGQPPGTMPAASQPAVASPSEIAQLLKQHGAIQDVQRPLRIGISRKDSAHNAAVFNKSPDDSNRFTLLELIASSQTPQVDPYGAALDPYRAAVGLPNPYSGALGLPFPDFANLKIHRLEPKGGEREIKVDLNAALESGDCSKDMWLEWGDVVEIPERDHKLNELWQGMSQQVLDSLQRCVKRTVDIIVKGQSTKVILIPSAGSNMVTAGSSPGVNPLGRYAPRLQQVVERAPKGDAARREPTLQNCWLSYVVRNVDVLLASSDLSRVQVKRVDPVTKQTREFVFNLEQAEPHSDLWLRDGDVIEVPEKQ